MKTLAPVVLFAYKRPEHLKRTLYALQKNPGAKQSDLYVFSDAPKTIDDEALVKEVRQILKKITGFKKIKVWEQKKNKGLAASIIDGVTQIVNRHGRVIVLEDDMETSPFFLQYMNKTLDLYKNNPEVASVHGYVFPIKNLPETFFLKGADCWGWGTWQRAWKNFEPSGKKLLSQLKKQKLTKEFDFNDSYPYTKMLINQIRGLNNSWAIRWYASAFIRDMVTLYPGKSLVKNIGTDEGTHFKKTKKISPYFVKTTRFIKVEKINTIPHAEAFIKFQKFFKDIQPHLPKKLFILLRKFLSIFH
jgi:hypothetical protein